MAFNNFTVSVVSFNETAGVDWTIAQPSVSLIITPNTGYTITAANFSPITPLPTYVNSVVFTQNGANIDCVITYIAPSIMPSANVLIELCIQGIAIERQICVAGVVSQCDVSDTKVPRNTDPDVSYAACGIIGSTSTVVASYQVTAESTYYYPTAPTLAVVIGDPNNYTITDVKSYDASGNIIGVLFAVEYTFPLNDVTGDKICLTANAVQIYNPPVKITSYSFPISGNVPSGGLNTSFNVFGIEGAAWNLVSTSTGLGIPIAAISGVLDSTGTTTIAASFPSVTVDTTYTITLSGDLASTFDTPAGQPSTITIYQYVNTTLGFRFTTTNTDIITPLSVTSLSFTPNIVPSTNFYTYDVVATSNQNINLGGIPNPGEWSNQNQNSPLYEFGVQSHSFLVNNSASPSTLTATVVVSVDETGTPSVISELDLDNYLVGAGSYSAVDCTATTVFNIDIYQGWINDPSTGLAPITFAYNIDDVVVVKDTINGTEYCVRITGTSTTAATTFINTAVNNGTGVYGTCNQCDEL
tara:strand:+ start:380 stop:1960 length:1581 start_codon:yes stop_codon:yes gene_type:complete